MSGNRMQAKRALFREDEAGLRQAIESGWSVDELDCANRSLLWYAAADGRWAQARLLMAFGADPGHALAGVLTQGAASAQTVRELAERVRDVSAMLIGGKRALHLACSRGLYPAVETLLDMGANPQLTDGFGLSPLADSMSRFSEPAGEALRAAGASLDHISPKGQSLAHHAVYWDASKALAWLIKHKAAFDQPNDRNETPLDRAIMLGRVDCARRLIAAGADVSRRGARGKTPLYWAIAKGREELARELIAAGADPEQKTGKNGHGRSALALARQNHSGKQRSAALSMMETCALEGALGGVCSPKRSKGSNSL